MLMLMRRWSDRGSAPSVEFGMLLPVVLTLLLLVFETARFFFVSVQLNQILQQVAWDAKLGRNRDFQENAVAIAGKPALGLVDPETIRLTATSAESVASIMTTGVAGVGGSNHVVRYSLVYDYRIFGGFGDRAWGPYRLEFIQVNRNEPDI